MLNWGIMLALPTTDSLPELADNVELKLLWASKFKFHKFLECRR